MSESVVIKGRLVSPTHVELLQPVGGVRDEVEVVVHPNGEHSSSQAQGLIEFFQSLPAGTRTKEDIDAQLREERDSWENGR